MIRIVTPIHDKRFASPAVAWEWLRKQRPNKQCYGSGILRMWLQTARPGQAIDCHTKHGATRLEVAE